MIEITGNGFILFNNKMLTDNLILPYLSQDVKVDDHFTLRSFFMMLKHYPQLSKLNFHTHEYMDVVQKTESYQGSSLEESHRLVFNTFITSEIEVAYNKKFNISVVDNVSEKSAYVNNYFIEDILDCPFSIGNKATFILLRENVQLLVGDQVNIERPCSLFEFIDATLMVISRNMSPDKRNEMIDMHEKACEVITHNIMKDINKLLAS